LGKAEKRMTTPAEFQQATGASSEAMAALGVYETLLRKWQKQINLVGAATLKDVWGRHFLDSAQLQIFSRKASDEKRLSWLDLGTGAGFPGLVLAILGEPKVFLVEKNFKKCAFLRAAIRETDAMATVIPSRLENVAPFPVDRVTARALAPLNDILDAASLFLKPGGEVWLLKGRGAEDELTAAEKFWTFKATVFQSRTDPGGKVLRIVGLARKALPRKKTAARMAS
jgi:16S rRNA (guanine527-N7)-methyltransferase